MGLHVYKLNTSVWTSCVLYFIVIRERCIHFQRHLQTGQPEVNFSLKMLFLLTGNCFFPNSLCFDCSKSNKSGIMSEATLKGKTVGWKKYYSSGDRTVSWLVLPGAFENNKHNAVRKLILKNCIPMFSVI